MLSEASNTSVYIQRILQSAEFARSKRMAEFLRHIIAKTEAGETRDLKERTIGIAVFSRSSDWDPKLDTIVRSEARRLRAKLDDYYKGAGKEDAIRLTIPKGSYIPEWRIQQDTPYAPVGLEPTSLSAVELPPPEIGKRKWTRWLAVSVVPLIVCTVSVWFLRSNLFSGNGSPSANKSVDFETVPFATEAGQQFSPSISPDGKKIAFVWDGGRSNLDIYVKEVKTGALERLTDAAMPDTHPAWSPDGRQMAYLRLSSSSSDLLLRNLQSGQERKLASIGRVEEGWASENPFAGCQSPTWSADQKKLILTEKAGDKRGNGLIYITVDSGAKTKITFPASGDEDCNPRFSPDGRTLAFIRYISHGQSDIYTANKDGGQLKPLTFDHKNIRGLSWTPDGKQIVFVSNRQGSYEIRTISRSGGKSDLLPSNTASASEPVVAPDGNWMAFVERAENWNIWRAKLDGSGLVTSPERFLASSGQNHSPSFSPDGNTIAFVSDRSGNPEIWFSDSDGTHLRQMTHFGGPWLGTIRWSPDSKKIVFDARPKGHSAIFILSTAELVPKLIEEGDVEFRRPAWSRDGESIYFDVTHLGKPQIHKLNLSTRSSRPLAPLDSLAPMESVDGRLLFFTDTNHDLWMSKADGSQSRVVREVRPRPELDWTVSETGLYFASDETNFPKVFFYRFSNRKVAEVGQLSQPLAQGTPSLVISQDRKWLLYVTVDYIKSDIKIRRTLTPL